MANERETAKKKQMAKLYTREELARRELRDYFAGLAMQGLIASNDEGAGDRLSEVPEYAYMIADAMLKARNAK